ncbi:MAG: hypothetical protein HC889_20510, partial [Synechococcaceae cyanobacterium SM1_2_3]|nr:hypothetical protein [Synechococcaceae cyanobacterium SM1_2_3]
AFQAVFESAGVEFDPQAGGFKFRQPVSGHIDLSGSGLPRYGRKAPWSGRGLWFTREAISRRPCGSRSANAPGNRSGESADLNSSVNTQRWRAPWPQ